jgi:hypothetical protein
MHLLPVTLVALALALPAPAFAVPNLELGVQDDPVLLDQRYGDSALALDRAAAMGADRVRVNVVWAHVMPVRQARAKRAPRQVRWDFSQLERLYAGAAARGLRLQVTLTGPAPRWATSDRRIGTTNPSPRHYGRFVRALAQQFAGRVDRYSVWNEPNWHRRLRPSRTAAGQYRKLYARGHAAIKRVDPAAQVFIGELMPGANSRLSTPALAFLRRMTCVNRSYERARSCAPLRADGFAHHPYNFARRPSAARNANRDIVEMGSLSRLTKALDRLAAIGRLRTPSGAKMPVYLTEFGYFTSGPIARSSKQHAAWMTEAWRIAQRNPRVRQLLQYLLLDPPKGVSWRTAVMKRDGTPRRVYFALQKLAR